MVFIAHLLLIVLLFDHVFDGGRFGSGSSDGGGSNSGGSSKVERRMDGYFRGRHALESTAGGLEHLRSCRSHRSLIELIALFVVQVQSAVANVHFE